MRAISYQLDTNWKFERVSRNKTNHKQQKTLINDRMVQSAVRERHLAWPIVMYVGREMGFGCRVTETVAGQ